MNTNMPTVIAVLLAAAVIFSGFAINPTYSGDAKTDIKGDAPPEESKKPRPKKTANSPAAWAAAVQSAVRISKEKAAARLRVDGLTKAAPSHKQDSTGSALNKFKLADPREDTVDPSEDTTVSVLAKLMPMDPVEDPKASATAPTSPFGASEGSRALEVPIIAPTPLASEAVGALAELESDRERGALKTVQSHPSSTTSCNTHCSHKVMYSNTSTSICTGVEPEDDTFCSKSCTVGLFKRCIDKWWTALPGETGGCADTGNRYSGWLTKGQPYSAEACAKACSSWYYVDSYYYFTISSAATGLNCKCNDECPPGNEEGNTAYITEAAIIKAALMKKAAAVAVEVGKAAQTPPAEQSPSEAALMTKAAGTAAEVAEAKLDSNPAMAKKTEAHATAAEKDQAIAAAMEARRKTGTSPEDKLASASKQGPEPMPAAAGGGVKLAIGTIEAHATAAQKDQAIAHWKALRKSGASPDEHLASTSKRGPEKMPAAAGPAVQRAKQNVARETAARIQKRRLSPSSVVPVQLKAP